MVYSVGIVTVSDRVSAGTAIDLSGPALAKMIAENPQFQSTKQTVVKDNHTQIQNIIKEWCSEQINLILLTGGTGFGVRDITPEAVSPLLDKLAPGLTTAMITSSLAITPFAALSRPVCGVRDRTIIITLPGSPKGSTENLLSIIKILPHALDLCIGEKDAGNEFHSSISKNQIDYTKNQQQPLKKKNNHTCGGNHNESDHITNTSDPLNGSVASRSRKSNFKMISYPEALSITLSTANHLPTKLVKIDHSIVGRVLAQDVYCLEDVPAYRTSIVDGYAIFASDGPGEYPVSTSTTAGPTIPTPLPPKTISRITTGAPLPPNATAVVMVEDTDLTQSSPDSTTELKVRVKVSVEEGRDVREVGSDIAKGELVLEKGTVLTGAEVGVLCMSGVGQVFVYEKARVGVLSTGDEVRDVNGVEGGLGRGEIWDCNRPVLCSVLESVGVEFVDLGICKDEMEVLKKTIEDGLKKVDVLVTTGGVSMGEKDLLKPILEHHFGGKIHFGRVALKPGKPTTFVEIPKGKHFETNKLCFGLPGNPVSAMVTFYLFVLPALRKMTGHKSTTLPSIKVAITEDIELDPRPEFQRAQAISVSTTHGYEIISGLGVNPKEHVGFVASVTGFQRSSRLMSLVGANVLLVLPARSESKFVLKKGECVEALVIERLG